MEKLLDYSLTYIREKMSCAMTIYAEHFKVSVEELSKILLENPEYCSMAKAPSEIFCERFGGDADALEAVLERDIRWAQFRNGNYKVDAAPAAAPQTTALKTKKGKKVVLKTKPVA